MIKKILFTLSAITSGFVSVGFLAGSSGLTGLSSVTWWSFAVLFGVGALVFVLLAMEA